MQEWQCKQYTNKFVLVSTKPHAYTSCVGTVISLNDMPTPLDITAKGALLLKIRPPIYTAVHAVKCVKQAALKKQYCARGGTN